MKRLLLVALAICSCALAQQTPLDMRQSPSSFPAPTVYSLPGACSLSQVLYYVPIRTMLVCGTSNDWHQYTVLESKVVNLPPVTLFPGLLAKVVDGATATDCTTGGGSDVVECAAEGVSYSAITGGGGGGGGSSIFTSYQFGTNAALTGAGLYLQTTYPNIFTLTQTGAGTSGSPFVDAVTLASQSQNLSFMSPNGSAGPPLFRAIAVADVPVLNQSTTGNASTATNLASYPATCNGTTQFSEGLSSGSNNCANWPTFNQSTTGNAATATNVAGGLAGSVLYQTGAGTSGFLASVGYSAMISGVTNPSWSTPTGNGQCFMSGASNYATTSPSFQTCPSGGSGGTVVTTSSPYTAAQTAAAVGNVVSTNSQVTLPASPPSSTFSVIIQCVAATCPVLPNGVTLYDLPYPGGGVATRYVLQGQWMSIATDGTSYYAKYSTNGSTYIFVTNAGSTGTTVNTWTKLTGAPSTAVIAATTDTAGMVGVCVAGCGTTGLAVIQTSGITPLLFAAGTTAGGYGTISSGTAGNGAYSATPPTIGPFARIQSTNGSGGIYNVDLIAADTNGGTGGGISFPQTVSGTTTSGGIPYLSSATTLSSSGLLASGHVLLGGGAGSAPTSDSKLDDGVTTANQLTYTGSAGISGAEFSNSTGTGFFIWNAFTSNDLLLWVNDTQAMYWSNSAYPVLRSNAPFEWSSTTVATGTADTGLSRDAAGVVDFGTGAQGSTAGSWKATNGTLSNQLTSTVATGTAPFVVASTTQVANLNAATAGNATTATNLSSYPSLCSGVQFSQGLSSGSNNCAPTANVIYCEGSASATAASCTGDPLATTYTNMTGLFIAGATSTGALTLNTNALGAISVYLNGAATSATNFVVSGQIYPFFYDNTFNRIQLTQPSTFPGLVSASGFSAGSSAPAVTGTGILGLGESTGQACASGADCIEANSSSHQALLSNNNATAVPIAVTPATTTANNIPVYSGTTGSVLGAGITPGTGVATALAAGVSGTGAICLASGSVCASGGSNAFSALTSSTNTTAAMVVGTGASLSVSGTGTINATEINGATIPASAAPVSTNSSGQIINSTVTGTGTTVVLATSPTLVTPALGTPSSGNASNLSNLPITLTTTGSSGAATYTQSTSTLNIPQYSGGSGNVAYCSGSASATAATCTGTPSPTTYTALSGSFIAGATSTGAPLTLNINSLGAKNVYLNGTATSATNFVISGQVYSFTYDGTEIQLSQPSSFPSSVSVGSSPPTCTGGTAGAWCATEGTAFTNVSGTAGIYPDSTAHEFLAKTNGASGAGMMVRAQPGAIRSTGLTAAVTTATLCAASAGACNVSGMYHVHVAIFQTGTACTSNATGGVSPTLTWTDGNGTAHSAQGIPMDTNASLTAVTGTMLWNASTLGAWGSGDLDIDTNGSIIQYSIGFAQCSVSGTATYSADFAVTRIQ